MISYSKNMSLDELAKAFIKNNINEAEGLGFGMDDDLASDIAGGLWVLDESVKPMFMYDVEAGMKYIADNARDFKNVWFKLNDIGSEINPLSSMEKCISRAISYSMKEILAESSIIQEYTEELEEGKISYIQLTSDDINNILDDLELETNREYER